MRLYSLSALRISNVLTYCLNIVDDCRLIHCHNFTSDMYNEQYNNVNKAPRAKKHIQFSIKIKSRFIQKD